MGRSWFPMFRSTWSSYINDLPEGQRWVAATLFSMAPTKAKTRRIGGQFVDLQPGQLFVTVRKLAETANVSRGVVERAIRNLEAGHTISVDPGRHGTIITLLNYDEFRLNTHDPRDADGTQGVTPTGHEQDAAWDAGHDTSRTPRGTRGGTPRGTPGETLLQENKNKTENKNGRGRARGADARLELAGELWAEQEHLRSQLGCRPLALTPGSLAPVVRILSERSADDCRHVLAVYAAEAKAKGSARWFNGVTNWEPKNFARALAVRPEDVTPAPTTAGGYAGVSDDFSVGSDSLDDLPPEGATT